MDAAAWLEGDRDWLSRPPEVDPARVLKDAERWEDLMGAQFELFFGNFISLCRSLG
jgi:hypothetical protein